jgi:hypothetical protein
VSRCGERRARGTDAGVEDRGEPLWKGRLRVIETGSDVPSKASIRLEDNNTGSFIPFPWVSWS